MEDNNAVEIWEKAWSKEVHTTDYALKRIQSAKSAKLTPVKIDTTDFYGYFQGSHGRYETFLDYCPCGDFLRSKLPCKHIYRLAMELGLMTLNFETNIDSIPTPKSEIVSLNDTVDMIENLSDEAQIELLLIASAERSSKADTDIMVPLDQTALELLNSGLITESTPPKHKIQFGKKNEITELLNRENILYDKKAKKSELEELCINRIPEKAEETFGKKICIIIPKLFRSRSIHFYLHRKYDTTYFFDEDGNYSEIRLLNTVLPDDNITEQLVKRGYYLRT